MSQASERAILGAMLSQPLPVEDALARLRWDDFRLESHQKIFRTMAQMHELGQGIDYVAVIEAMGGPRSPAVESLGGTDYVMQLQEGIPRNIAIETHLSIIENAALSRRGAAACQQALTRLADPTETAVEVLDDLARNIAGERPDQSAHVSEVIQPALRVLDGDAGERWATGIGPLDDLTRGGIRPKQLWVVGALPSGGKSSLLRQIERAVMPYGVHSHSIEVPKDDWVRFHVAFQAGVPAWKLFDPQFLSFSEKNAMREAASAILGHAGRPGWNHFIDDDSSVHIRTLLAKSRLSAMRHGTRIHTVDYLQMIEGPGNSRHEQMGYIARKLKQFAKDNNCAVIALSQLDEERGKGSEDPRPSLKHLRESGDIRQAADVIVLNYRPKQDDQYTGMDELILAKQRNGPIGKVNVTYDSKTLTFKPREE